jgi:hypothetical protein
VRGNTEARKLPEKGDSVTLKYTRWVLVKRGSNLSSKHAAVARVTQGRQRGMASKRCFV